MVKKRWIDGGLTNVGSCSNI